MSVSSDISVFFTDSQLGAQVMRLLVQEKLGFLTVQTLETLAVEDWGLLHGCGRLLGCLFVAHSERLKV